MKTFLGSFVLFGCLLLSILQPPVSAAAIPLESDYSKVDEYIHETMDRLPIAGLSLAIVKGDQILYMQGYGDADSAGTPVTPQTPFMIGSITKSFTALAIHQLVAAGKLDLAAPLRTYIPEFRLADPQSTAAVTVQHLLDHTSGISTQEGVQPYVHDPKITFDQALARLARYKPDSAPGEMYAYSNWNYVLLGEVIARVSGQSYVDYMQSNILDPLEMTNASFADHHSLPGVATGHVIAFGLPFPHDEKYIPVMLSAGYLTASAEELAHYLIPFFNQGQYHGRSLLPAQGQGWYDAIWNWQPGFPPDVSYSYSGAHNSFNTAFQLFSRHKVGVVVLMNTRLDLFVPGPTASEIAFNVARIVINFPYELPSNRSFYLGYAVFDGLLLLLAVSIIWQATRLKGWVHSFQSAGRGRKVAAWLGVGFNWLVAVAIGVSPIFMDSNWLIMLRHRTSVAVALLVVGLPLAILGITKLVLILKQRSGSREMPHKHPGSPLIQGR